MGKTSPTPILFSLSISIGLSIFVSCQKELSCEGCLESNKPPVAKAGLDQVIALPKDSILLDGSASNDPDGTIIKWLWTKISDPAAFKIDSAASAKTTVRDLDTGTYQFELEVTDNGGLYSKDTVRVSVIDTTLPNRPPVANAGPDQTIELPTNIVSLNGSGSTDPDNNITGYTWTKISGPSLFSITNANAAQTDATNLGEGIYQFELTVMDAGGLISKDTMQVTVTAAPTDFPPCFIANPPFITATLTEIGKLSVPRMPTAAAAGNKVVFAGGWSGFTCTSNWLPASSSSTVDIYDTQTNSWSTAQLSTPRGGIRSVSLGNKIFFAGGEDGNSTVYDNVDIYDISSNTWTLGHLSSPRAYVATAAIGNKVFFAGGFSYDGSSTTSVPGKASNIVDIYDVSTNQWTATTLSGTGSGLITATAVNGKVYFAGGFSGGIISIYDHASGTWSTSNLQFPWSPGTIPLAPNPLVSFAAGDDIYWAGAVDEGFNDQFGDNIYTGRAEVRNTANNTTSIKCFPLILSQHPVYRNNDVAFFESYSGRYIGGWGVNNYFHIYNIATGNWSIGYADYSFFTFRHDAGIVSANNTVYVGGGSYPGTCVDLQDKVYILSW
jgi:hypothetical protein